jgi:hypothetical protein
VIGTLGLWAVLGLATPAAAQPDWWMTVGGQGAIETGRLSGILEPEGAIVFGGGLYFLRLGPLLLGADLEGTAGRRTADLVAAQDTVYVYRVRVGARISWWHEDDEPRWVPYARVGGVYRLDRGDFVNDDGAGYYATLGLEIRLTDTWSLGPFVGYEAVSLSVDTESFLFGFVFTFSR